ncbi:efflux RND transporter permease subunit [Paraburkholderia caledonica]|uniref:Multidrug transporter n=1 Tax=Paraburkholderia caledonica TaxID=134536 RepID=A0AB73IMU1_9BURK|nr:hypothetical protein [Paraburkholderia caledonica]
MDISRPFILRPVATGLVILAFLLIGLIAYRIMPVSELPEVDYPTVQVYTQYPGAPPDVVSASVTAPLEKQFGQMGGLMRMNSTSALGVSRSGSGSTTQVSSSGTVSNYASRSLSAQLEASWEPDLWGSVRRSVEASEASAQASDAQLAGERLSVLATLAVDYFTVRAADADLAILDEERRIDAELLALTEAKYKHGVSSYDDVRSAHNTLHAIDESIASAQLARRQYEHAIAVLIGGAPAAFSFPVQADYRFDLSALPVSLPSALLQRRPDVVQAERTVAQTTRRSALRRRATSRPSRICRWRLERHLARTSRLAADAFLVARARCRANGVRCRRDERIGGRCTRQLRSGSRRVPADGVARVLGRR